MKNISFDTTSFSDQLGLYDFFNVLIYGATFASGASLICERLSRFLWDDLTFPKSLGIVLLIYITGMLLQELGSKVDEYITKLYRGMHQRVLSGKVEEPFEKETGNDIIKNPAVLKKYQDVAKSILTKDGIDKSQNIDFDNEYINGYIFSVSQYYVSVKGKDKKVEKLRALFSMSKTLMSCFFLLAICAVGVLLLNIDMSIGICSNLGLSIHGCEHCIDKIIVIALFAGIGVAFWFRAKRTMRNFLLILLGTFNAILEEEKLEKRQGDNENA